MARYLVNGSRRGEKTALPVMKTRRLDPQIPALSANKLRNCF